MAIVKDLIVLGSTRQIGPAYAGTIYAESFVKNGSDSSHVLLGDGSDLALSSLNSSHTHYVGTTQVQNSSAAQGLTGITSIASPASTALYISPASTLYLDSAASTSILFRKGTTEMARFNTSSNLCIGTTSPNDNTTYKLDVGGKGRFSNQIVSSLASGTAPFVVASSTVVSNLNADLLDGKHASAFALSSHDHNRILFIDTRSSVETPTNVAAYDGIRIDFKNKSASSIPSSGTWTAVVSFDGYSDTSGGYPSQIGFSMSDLSESRPFYFRSPKTASQWGAWRCMLDSLTYTAYTVDKQGLGATGTWGINISGNAATASSVDWNNITNVPGTFAPSTHTHAYLYSYQASATQTNLTWIKAVAASPLTQRSHIYNTSGVEWNYLVGFRNSAQYGAALQWGYNDKYLRIIRSKAGVWTSDDWEKISAGFADSAPWSGITGKPSTFAPSAHNHDDRYVTELGTIQNYLTWTKGDLTAMITVPYATKAGTVTINTNSANAAYNIVFNSGTTLYSDSDIQLNPNTGEVTAKHFTVTHANGGDNEFRVKYSTTVDMAMMIGSGNTNHGLYDIKNSKWMIVADQSGNVTVNGNATTATTATNLASNPSFQTSGTTQITVTAGNKTSAAFTVPYATTASKLGSSTVGAPNKPIYLNAGTPTAVTSVGEAFLSWGGQNLSSNYSPVDAAMVPRLGANRLAFLPAANIKIEYSTDGGTTWIDYGATDAQKINLFSTGSTSFYTGHNSTTGGGSTNNKLRVTIVTTPNGVYTTLNKFVMYVATSGASNCYCTIKARKQSDYESERGTTNGQSDGDPIINNPGSTSGTTTNQNGGTWTTFAENVAISGWSGWNVINLTAGLTTYGNTKTTQYGQIQFIFGYNTYGGSSIGLNISQILGFGGMGWSTPSNMAREGHLYSFDSSQNMILPAALYSNATTETQNLGTSSKRWNVVYAKSLNLSDYSNISTGIGLSNYLPLAGGTMTGAISRNYTAASSVPVLNVASSNQDIWLWRVRSADSGTSSSVDKVYGFGAKYLGTGTGNNNSWAMYADNQNGTQTKALEMKQSGDLFAYAPIHWANSTALPEDTSPTYILTTDSFTNGGKTKWTSKANLATSIGLGNYLPLAGGTMTGNITMGTSHYIYGINETYGSMLYFDGTRTVVGSVGASTTSATLIRSKTGHTEVNSGSGTTYTIWDSGNDGSGSGLDADMLDGKHATYFTPATWMNSYLKLSGGTITGDLTATENTVLNNLFVMGDTILGSIESNSMLINYNRIGFNNTSIEFENLQALWGTL